jgi:NitT/TauT family transport system ATP-binding protein
VSGLVEVKDLTITFPGKTGAIALTGMNVTLKPGSFTAVIGPSGCGKSTLLNAIAGFVTPSEGSITLDGVKVDGASPERGVVFQQYGLFPWFSAAGNIEFALKRSSIPKKSNAARPSRRSAKWDSPRWPIAFRSSSRAA